MATPRQSDEGRGRLLGGVEGLGGDRLLVLGNQHHYAATFMQRAHLDRDLLAVFGHNQDLLGAAWAGGLDCDGADRIELQRAGAAAGQVNVIRHATPPAAHDRPGS